MEDAQVYVGQKAFINKGGKILAIQDSATLLWDYPGGKIRWNESLEDALKREVLEETGLQVKVGSAFVVWKHEVIEKSSRSFGKRLVLIGIKCHYLAGEVTLSGEHSDFDWVTSNDLGKASFTRQWLYAIKEYFRDG